MRAYPGVHFKVKADILDHLATQPVLGRLVEVAPHAAGIIEPLGDFGQERAELFAKPTQKGVHDRCPRTRIERIQQRIIRVLFVTQKLAAPPGKVEEALRERRHRVEIILGPGLDPAP